MTIRKFGLVTLAAAMITGAAYAEDAAGKWSGVVKAPDGDIPFLLTVAKDEAGKLSAVGESPSQAPGVQIPAETVVSDGASLSFQVAAVGGSYAGVWDEAKKSWVGVWKQSGFDMPLDLARSE